MTKTTAPWSHISSWMPEKTEDEETDKHLHPLDMNDDMGEKPFVPPSRIPAPLNPPEAVEKAWQPYDSAKSAEACAVALFLESLQSPRVVSAGSQLSRELD